MSVTTYGFMPGAVQDTFVPDQLIAGNLKLVTQTVGIAGGQGVLQRGTVVGLSTSGANEGAYTLSAMAATDGSQSPSAILVDTVDTTGGAVQAGVYLMGEFNANYLSYGAGWTIATLTVALRPLSIFIKQAVSGDIVL